MADLLIVTTQDALSPEQAARFKERIIAELEDAGHGDIKPLLLTRCNSAVLVRD